MIQFLTISFLMTSGILYDCNVDTLIALYAIGYNVIMLILFIDFYSKNYSIQKKDLSKKFGRRDKVK